MRSHHEDGERPDLKDRIIDQLRAEIKETRNKALDEAAKIAGNWSPSVARQQILKLKSEESN